MRFLNRLLGTAILAASLANPVFAAPPTLTAVVSVGDYDAKKPLANASFAAAYGSFSIPTPCNGNPDPAYATDLCGASVLVNGQKAGLNYVGATQINFVMPDLGDKTVNGEIKVVIGGETSNALTRTVQPTRPSFLRTTHDGVIAAALHETNPSRKPNDSLSYVLSLNNPLRSDDTGTMKNVLAIWYTGCGEHPELRSRGVPVGGVTPTDRLYDRPSPGVTVDGVAASIVWNGLAPGLPGRVCQLNIRVPDGLPDGAHDLTMTLSSDTDTAGVPTKTGDYQTLSGTITAQNISIQPTSDADKAKNTPQKKFDGKLSTSTEETRFTTDSAGNYLLRVNNPTATHTLRITSDGRYENFTLTGTVAEINNEKYTTVGQILVDTRAPFQIDRDKPVDTVSEANIWVALAPDAPPDSGMDNATFAQYSHNWACTLKTGVTFNDCLKNSIPVRKWTFPIQTLIDYTNLGSQPMTVAPGNELPAAEAVRYTLNQLRINGKPVHNIVEVADPTKPLLTVGFQAEMGGYAGVRFDKDDNAVSGDTVSRGTMWNTSMMLHEDVHAAGLLRSHSISPYHEVGNAGWEFYDCWKGSYSPFIQATLDLLDMKRKGQDLRRFTAPTDLSKALRIYANGPNDYTIAYPK